MREVAIIQQKQSEKSIFFLLFLAGGIIFYAVSKPGETANIIRDALSTAALRIIPSLFAFSVASKLLIRCGLLHWLAMLPFQGCYRLLGVSPSGFAAFVIGALAGFPTGAAVLSEAVALGAMDREEAARLLPFCNNAGISFLLGVVGLGIFDSARIGWMFFFAQLASALFSWILIGSKPTLSDLQPAQKQKSLPSASSALTSSVCEGVFSMLSVGGYLVFFSLLSHMILKLLDCFFPLTEEIAVMISGFFELSGGLSLLSKLSFPVWERALICGMLLGFGGFSVFLQAADLALRAGISTRFYFTGKGLTLLFCTLFSSLFCMTSVYKFGILLIFFVFGGILCIGAVKNLIIFEKTMEKAKRMLYNKNELECP